MEAKAGNQPALSVRTIVVAGVLAAIALVLGFTQTGFVPVPNPSGRATILHVPVIIGAVLEGPVVGGLIGLIFGITSFLTTSSVALKNPIVSILPRILIGITTYYSYAALKRWNEYVALAISALVGTATNTIFVLGLAGLFGTIAWAAMPAIILTQSIWEAIAAMVLTVAIVGAWKGIESGRGGGSRKV